MRQFRFSSSTVGGSEVGSIRRNLRRSVCVSVYMAISDINYTRYCPSDLFVTGGDRSISAVPVVLISCNNSIFLFSVSSYWFDVPNRFIGFWLYTPFRALLRCFRLRCFTLVRLLIARAPCTNNPLSIRHYAVFTPCEGIPLSTIYSTSPRGVDRAVLFVCLPLFRRLTNNGPIAVIGDSVLRT